MNLTDPIVLMGLAGSALYAFGSGKLMKMAGLGLGGVAIYKYVTRPKPATAQTQPAGQPLIQPTRFDSQAADSTALPRGWDVANHV